MLLVPACCRVWQLKLLHREKSNSKNVRDSPQGVGVRVSMLILDCCGVNSNTPLPREWLTGCATKPSPGTNIWPSGTDSRFPFWRIVEVGVPGFPLAAPCKKY